MNSASWQKFERNTAPASGAGIDFRLPVIGEPPLLAQSRRPVKKSPPPTPNRGQSTIYRTRRFAPLSGNRDLTPI